MNRTTLRADGVTLAEVIVDHGDGTGTRTVYGDDGTTIESTETVDCAPTIDQPVTVPIRADALAELATAAQAATTIAGLRQALATFATTAIPN